MNKEQREVLVGIESALSVGILVFAAGTIFGDSLLVGTHSAESRFHLLMMSLMVPVAMLAVSIIRVAKHHFFTPEDIDGSGLKEGMPKAKVLSALLQSTLEQVTATILIYPICAFVFPPQLLIFLPLAALMFFFGRIAFFVSYEKGVGKRAFGFGLTFYPTVMVLLLAIYFLIMDTFA